MSGTSFSTWMGRFEAVLGNHGMQLSDHDKTGALLSKLDLETYNSYTDHIMPRTPVSLSYEETKEVLEDMLGDKISVFRRRIDVMRLAIGNISFRKPCSTINRRQDLHCKEQNMQTLEPDCYRSLRNNKGACWRTWRVGEYHRSEERFRHSGWHDTPCCESSPERQPEEEESTGSL